MMDGPNIETDIETDIRPVGATRVSETGIHEGSLFKLILKTLFVRSLETPKQVADSTALHIAVVRELLETAKQRASRSAQQKEMRTLPEHDPTHWNTARRHGEAAMKKHTAIRQDAAQ